MKFSVIIPAFNAEEQLTALLASLSQQSEKDFEVIVVDDASSDRTADAVRNFGYRLSSCDCNRGPAFCRNRGAELARGDILVFTDSDCVADMHWLRNIRRHFEAHDIQAVMGKMVIPPSTFLGDAVAGLGFPGGGSIGFERIWPVDKDGYTHSLSTCNCAIKKEIFLMIGGFDTSFPYAGGEDSFLAYKMCLLGQRIRFCRDVVVMHPSRDKWREFLYWQFKRGVSSFIFAGKIARRGQFVSLRVWSSLNVLRHHRSDKKLPLIVLLLGMSLFLQLTGFCFARIKRDSLCTS